MKIQKLYYTNFFYNKIISLTVISVVINLGEPNRKIIRLILNDRQIKVIQSMLESGINGFKGGMSAKKYMSIGNTSKATATRGLQMLLEMGVMSVQGG